MQYSIEEDENDEDAENIFNQYEAYQRSKSSSSGNNQDMTSWRQLVNKISPYQFNIINANSNVNQQPVMYRRSDHKNYNQFNLNDVIIEEEEEEEEDEDDETEVDETEVDEENESPRLREEDSEGNQEVAEINVNQVCMNSEIGTNLHELSKHSLRSNTSHRKMPDNQMSASGTERPNTSANVNLSINNNNGSASSRSSQSSSSMSNHSVKSSGSTGIKPGGKHLSI